MSKVISGSSSSGYQRWELPLVEDVSSRIEDVKNDKVSGLLTAEKIEQIQAQAYQEAYEAGFKKGHQEGVQAGGREISQKSLLLEDVLNCLTRPFEQLDENVEVELVSLAVAVARQLVRRELKTDPGEVVAVVHEALAALPVASRNIKVCLHPEDVALMRDLLTQSNEERQWTLSEDPSLHRGDCRIVTESSTIEATLERRLATIAAQLLGGEREQDTQTQDV